jgi:hypothetical protein
MASQTTINLTGNDPRVVCSVLLPISPDADVDQARCTLLALARQHPKAKEVTGCPVTQWGTAGIVLSLDVWCADALTAIALRCDLLEQARKRFATEGTGIPGLQTSVVLRDARQVADLQDKTGPS